jgi:transcription initiation factor TFIIIB Brf1 subunit/transcription initiation factor TFIIB
MKIEYKKDLLGKYIKITYTNGLVYIERYFKELGLSIRIKEK